MVFCVHSHTTALRTNLHCFATGSSYPFTGWWLEPTDAPSYVNVVVGSVTGVMVYLLTIILIGLVIHFGVKGELWARSGRKEQGQG